MILFEDIKNQTTEEYFRNNQFSIDAFKKKYSLNNNETYIQAIKRVCDEIASVEKDKKTAKYWSERWFDEIYNDWWHPAGSIMQGAGSGKKISLANCTTVSLGNRNKEEEWDSLESIFKNGAYNIAKYAAYRQGQGIDFSRLRPRGTTVLNSSNESTGSIHWMKFIDSIAYYVGQKGRIPALLFSLSCTHPDLEEFITCKSDYTKIQNANISVQCTNDFYEAVINDKDWELLFEIPAVKIGEKIYIDQNSSNSDCIKDGNKYYYISKHNRPYEKITKKVKAKHILELIAKGMLLQAEPGIQNIDIAKKYSNSDYLYDPNDIYDSRILSTNACSEQYLSKDSCCILSSANCGKFSSDKNAREQELEKIAHSINRFLDNVNEYELTKNTYATPEQRLAIQKLRRTGAGYTNIGALLFKCNLEYGSKEGNKLIQDFTRQYNYYLYMSSIALGKEKGNFELFNRKKLEQSPFIERMKRELGLEFSSLRNCTVSSIAPTGTLSLMFREHILSYGIEPGFGIYFWKRTRISGKYEYYFCVPSIVREVFEKKGYKIPINSDTIKDTWDGQLGKPIADFIDKNKDKIGIKFKNAIEVSALDKLDLMSKVMKWIDSSISVTYMLSENSKWQDIYDFILEGYKKEVKSIAAFPDRQMYGIISYIPFKELAEKLIKDKIEIHPQNFSIEEQETLKLQENTSKVNNAIKRPKSLKCDIHIVKIDKKPYIVLVGHLQENLPYEVFVLPPHGRYKDKQSLETNCKIGWINKIKRGHYELLDDNNEVICDNIAIECGDEIETLARMASVSLRHNVPIQYIVDQLEKVSGDMLSPAKSIARVLKKYIKDGEIVTGAECPTCQSKDLQRNDGCVLCVQCGWSKC